MPTRTTHELKCWPSYYAAIRGGLKRFEVRVNDRDFHVGDSVIFRAWNPKTKEYCKSDEPTESDGTWKPIVGEITYLLTAEELYPFGSPLRSDFVIFGFEVI